MAVTAILPQRVTPAALRPLAAALTATHPDDSAFARALDRAVQYVEACVAYEPLNATHYRIQSHSRPYLWRYTTLVRCSCETRGLCWHRALLHLLTASYALQHLDRCPRPQLAHVPAHDEHDYAALVRACDELF